MSQPGVSRRDSPARARFSPRQRAPANRRGSATAPVDDSTGVRPRRTGPSRGGRHPAGGSGETGVSLPEPAPPAKGGGYQPSEGRGQGSARRRPSARQLPSLTSRRLSPPRSPPAPQGTGPKATPTQRPRPPPPAPLSEPLPPRAPAAPPNQALATG